jgi:HEPN domain-containing protein
LAHLQPDERRLDLMSRLSAFYFQSRYPGETQWPPGPAGHAHAEAALNETEETVKWLLSTLK